MSSIYITEPPTSGKVLIVTTRGDIDVELWCKEAPKTCRNFIQLCMEGYYDHTIFHRLIKGFIVQGGDPTGTGEGGESVYGEPFEDEFHQRLRFTRRGLLGMANSGQGNNDNASQFFFTLGPADELTNKHTVFGKVTGPTVFNMLKLGEGEVDANDRPEVIQRIIRTEILNNPFDDILPRANVRRQAVEEAKEKKRKKKSRVKAVKNFKLMSFGEEAEEDEATAVASGGKIKSSHDALPSDRALGGAAALDATIASPSSAKSKRSDADKAAPSTAPPQAKDSRPPPAKTPVAAEVDEEDLDYAEYEARMRARVEREHILNGVKLVPREPVEAAKEPELPPQKLKLLTPEEQLEASRKEVAALRHGLQESKRKRDEDAGKGQGGRPESSAAAFLRAQQEKYAPRGKKTKAAREEETMAMLNRFRSKVRTAVPEPQRDDRGVDGSVDEEATAESGWMTHELNDQETDYSRGIDPSLDPNTLDVFDPRNPMTKRRAEKKGSSSAHSRGSGSGGRHTDRRGDGDRHRQRSDRERGHREGGRGSRGADRRDRR